MILLNSNFVAFCNSLKNEAINVLICSLALILTLYRFNMISIVSFTMKITLHLNTKIVNVISKVIPNRYLGLITRLISILLKSLIPNTWLSTQYWSWNLFNYFWVTRNDFILHLNFLFNFWICVLFVHAGNNMKKHKISFKISFEKSVQWYLSIWFPDFFSAGGANCQITNCLTTLHLSKNYSFQEGEIFRNKLNDTSKKNLNWRNFSSSQNEYWMKG